MTQPGQIIPQWLHPHVETYVNDNTEFQEQVSAPETGIRSFFVFTSPKGRDGVLLEKNTTTAYIDEYGKPNFKLYGQPGYMPHAFLSSNQAVAYCMRVMPDDAAYSNSVVIAKVKVEDIPGSTPMKRLLIRFEVVNISNIQTRGELGPLAEVLTDPDPDADGFMTYPLFTVASLGRGLYGDALRFRLATAIQADKENAFKNYRFEVYELENSLKRKEVFEFTVDPDSLVGTQSMFAEDIVNDSDTGSVCIEITTIQDSMQAIFDLYRTEVNPTTDLTFGTFDIFYGRNKDAIAIPGIAYDTAHADYVALDGATGIPLAGGSDGSFSTVASNTQVREEAINAAYQRAFEGGYDAGIKSKRRVPAELVFDAGYSSEVKSTLISLVTKRGDAYAFIDAGILNSATDAVAWGETMRAVGNRVFSKECQHYKIRDPFNGKVIPVTITYSHAKNLPAHFAGPGNHIPYFGQQNAPLTGHIKNSLAPVIDADDTDTKEELYLLRVNYYQAIASNQFVRGSQSTSQNIWSDLSEESNMHVLLEIKRKIELLVSSVAYNFADAAAQLAFTESAQRIIDPYLGVKIATGSVEFKMSDWERQRSILHCYLAIQFRTLGKRGLIEIDINPRTA